MRIIFGILVLVITSQLYGQDHIIGTVTDQKGEPLPFVNILINGSNKDGVSTDIDGRFSIQHTISIDSLLFSYVGYQQLVLNAPFSSPLQVRLTSTTYEISTIEVIAGENPAHRIIKQAVANRLLNDHEQLLAYECITYNKMKMGFLPDIKKRDSVFFKRDTSKERVRQNFGAMQRAHQALLEHDMMLVETVSKRKFKRPNNIQEEILHNKVSGFKALPLATLATDAQPFTFYKDQISILDEPYLNPISKGSTRKYFFQLQDTLYQDRDSIYVISFQPKKGKNFKGLKGVLYIHTNQYAIKNVIAEPAEKVLLTFKIEQQYQWVANQHWFPEQLNFEFDWKDMGPSFLSAIGSSKTYIQEINFQPNFSKKLFRKAEEIVFDDKAFNTTDSIWNTYRLDSLTQREIRTYEVIDSIGEKVKVDQLITRGSALIEGRYPLGVVDWVWKNSIAFNNHEKVRLGLGLSTNETLSEFVELGGYYAYGFGDKEWKYGGNLNFYFDSYRMHHVELSYRKDIAVPAFLDFQLSDHILTPRLFANFIDDWEYKGAAFHSHPLKYWSTKISFGQHQFKPTYDYIFSTETPNSSFTFTELGIHFRYAYNEKFSRFLGYNIFSNTSFPVVELNYTKGFDGIWGGDYEYNKLVASIEHNFKSRFLGETHYRIEAGIIDNPLPLSRLFAAPAFGNNLSVQLLSNSFRTMEAYEFLSDRFVHIYFRQSFGSLLLKSKRFQPKIAIEHNFAIGSLQQSSLHQEIAFKTLEKGFFEVGLIINDLIRVNYLNMFYLGVGVSGFYRYGPNRLDSFKDNQQLQLTFTTSF